MTKAELARVFVEKYPTWSKKAIGKELYKAHPDRFRDSEAARSYIQKITGTLSKSGHNMIQTDKYIGPRLEPGDKFDNSPFILKAKKIGVICDVHIPFHDREALIWRFLGLRPRI